jgi:hypothetical protein
MKLVLTLVVRDEEDIIKANIDYHLAAGVDFVMVTDHRCQDRTMDIVGEYQRQGYASVQSQLEPGFYQARWSTEMARVAFERHAADWVICGDADEFWWVENGGTIKQILNQAPASASALRARRYNFVARSRLDDVNFLSSMTFREVFSRNLFGRRLLPKVCFRARPDVTVRQGNHSIMVGGEKVEPADTADLSIFHFPIRSKDQFLAKVRVHGEAYEQTELSSGVGSVKRKLYDLLKGDGLKSYLRESMLTDEELAAAVSRGDAVEDTRLRDFFAARGLRAFEGR